MKGFSLFITSVCVCCFIVTGARAQTNDPDLSQQGYLSDHHIEQVWNITKGSGSTKIAIDSLTGFTTTHEDMVGRFYNPNTEWFMPQDGYGSEVAGIIGANSNNGKGIAGIDWHAMMTSYNILRIKRSGDTDPNATYTYNGTSYYFDVHKLATMVSDATQDGMNIQVFTFGVPLANKNDLLAYKLSNPNYTIKRGLSLTPSFPQPGQNEFWDTFKNFLKSFGNSLVTNILSSNPPAVPDYFAQLQQNLVTAANNGQILISPIGDDNLQPVLSCAPRCLDTHYLFRS